MKRFSAIFTLILGLALIGAGCGLTTTVQVQKKAADTSDAKAAVINTNTGVSTSINYPGQKGKNALELLQLTHDVNVSAQGFVNAIDGRQPNDRQFWAFYVNDQQADVGAKDYQTNNDDKIEWKIEKF